MRKWLELVAYLSEESALMGTRINAVALLDLYEAGRAELVEVDGQIVAFAALWDTPSEDWFELGSVWVHPEFRGRSFGSQVFQKLLVLAQAYKVFLITHNPKIMHLALQAGWIEADLSTWSNVPFLATCDPCDRWQTDGERMRCKYRATRSDCQLFFFSPPK